MDELMNGGKLKHALQLGAAGYRVHPLHQKDGRVCRVNGWPEKASSDADSITALWQDRDVVAAAVATGHDLTVIDVDVPGDSHAHDGAASLRAAGVELPETLVIRTASGGWHYVYRTDGAARKSCANVEHPDAGPMLGVDVRGAGGFVKVHDARALIDGYGLIAPAPAWLPAADDRQVRGDTIRRSFFADLDARERQNWGKKAKPSKSARRIVQAFQHEAPNIDHDRLLTLTKDLAVFVRSGEPGASWAVEAARDAYVEGAPHRRTDWGAAFDAALLGSEQLALPLRGIALPARAAAPKVKRTTLSAADAVFNRWLGSDYDLQAMHAVLAAAAVERLNGDPIWLLLVSGSGNAKTETVSSLARAGAHVVSSISSAGALLSGTSGRERSKDATGGLLEEVGSRGIIVVKDVTSLLSLDRHARAEVFAALREVYDGRWSRSVGTDGGRTLDWQGRLVVVGAVTTAWDRVSADTIAAFGDRFAIVRMDSTTGRVAAGRQAIGNTGREAKMRSALAAAAAGVLKGAAIDVGDPDEDASARILAAADVVTLARTAVDLDYRGNVVDSHAPEMPTRFAKQLAQAWRGAVAIGMDRPAALALAIRVARDSMPPLRLEVLEDVAANPWTPLRDVVKRLQKPRATVDRALQALHLLGLLTVDDETTTATFSQRESTTWRYTVAPGIDISAVAAIEVPASTDGRTDEVQPGTTQHS